VVKGVSPDSLLDSYHAERHPVGARVLQGTMAQVALRRQDDRSKALADTLADLLALDEPRRQIAAEISGLAVRYDLGGGHPLLGRRMPDLDLDLETPAGPRRVYSFLHQARPVLLNLSGTNLSDAARWADRVQMVSATCSGDWHLPAIGRVTPAAAVLIRPDGHVCWTGEGTAAGLVPALTRWFGPEVDFPLPEPT
jgi:3-(3-hydroxy-phenyl)propionate hydroxylase